MTLPARPSDPVVARFAEGLVDQHRQFEAILARPGLDLEWPPAPGRSLVEFYVTEHNSKLPHSAFDGQTPDAMFFGTGTHVLESLATARAVARQARLATNRAPQCAACA